MPRRHVREPLPGFADRLGLEIRKRGLTQRDLAKRIGLSPNTLTRILQGHTEDPSASIVRSLAIELRISADYLLGIKVE